jgi:integrase
MNERRKKRLLHRIYELDIALGTGMRKGEQYGLRWSDIDFFTPGDYSEGH